MKRRFGLDTEALVAGFLVGLTRLITGVRAHWVDASVAVRPGARVYFAHHCSHLDTLVIWASLPRSWRVVTRPVAAADYWDRSGLRRWLAVSVLRAILVERAGRRGARESLRRLLAALDAGDSLILFPEGTRSDGEAVGTLHAGLYFIARERPAVELVPVHLENLSRILPKGEFLPLPLIASARFGPPLRLRAAEDREAFLERARLALCDAGVDR